VDLSFGGLLVALVVGAVGVGFFIYGRKQARIPHLIAGILLLAYPYFIPNPWVSAAIAAVILVALWLSVRMGA
jgi:hypothetical protein